MHIININMHISVRRNFYSSFKQAYRENYKSVVMKWSAAHCYSASYCYLASATATFRWSCDLVKGGIFVRCPQCTWCTSRHPSRSCFHLEWTALWTEDTQRPHSCPNVVSGMSCSLEWVWRSGQCAYSGLDLGWRKGGREDGEQRVRDRVGDRERKGKTNPAINYVLQINVVCRNIGEGQVCSNTQWGSLKHPGFRSNSLFALGTCTCREFFLLTN